MNDLIERAQAITLRAGITRKGSFMDDACTLIADMVAELVTLKERSALLGIARENERGQAMTQLCRWDIEDDSEFTALYHTDCGMYKQESLPKYMNFKFCPFCGAVIDFSPPTVPCRPCTPAVDVENCEGCAAFQMAEQEIKRLTTAAKAWEVQAKGYSKVIDRLERALNRIIKTRCKMLEPCPCCDADADIARKALNPPRV